MSAIVLLDAGPLGMITSPRSSPENEEGAKIVVPEIADYEVRRELLRADRINGLARLDADMILAAQAAELSEGAEAIIATTNVRHLARALRAYTPLFLYTATARAGDRIISSLKTKSRAPFHQGARPIESN